MFWSAVRNRKFLGLKWRRQVPIGKYYADFLCEKKQVIVELDGGHHGDQIEYDRHRTKVLGDYGYVVIRFWNAKITQDLDSALYKLERLLA